MDKKDSLVLGILSHMSAGDRTKTRFTAPEETFDAGEEIEITIVGVDDAKFDVHFGDGSIAFIRKNEVEVVSVN